MIVYNEIAAFIRALDTKAISTGRKELLLILARHITDRSTLHARVQLVFICTHNSRRSHLAQIWAQTMAAHYDIANVTCYSGGTEATALYREVLTVLKRIGFLVEMIAKGDNPIYAVRYSDADHPIVGFSKKYEHPFNPTSEFAAVMTCTSADEGCPVVRGSDRRIALAYDDPKVYDDTLLMSQKYHERSLEIATEMKYVFELVQEMLPS